MDLKELSHLVRFCKRHGVTHVKVGDVELTVDLSHEPFKRSKAVVKEAYEHYVDAVEAEDKSPAHSEPTDEDILFWSSTAPLDEKE